MKTKKFELTVTLTEDGVYSVDGKNDGFNALELIGILESRKQDILEQLDHPEKFKHIRTAVVDGEQIAIEEVDG